MGLMVQAPENRFFDINQAVRSKLQVEYHQDIQCGSCENIGVTIAPKLIGTQKVMIIQVNFIDSEGRKIQSRCSPLQNLDININGETKKYELQCIIEHIGFNYNSGHYMSYLKKNNTWYCANDRIITRIETNNYQLSPTSIYIRRQIQCL